MSTEKNPKVKARDSLAEMSKDGKFERRDSTYRQIVSDDHPIFKPERGRYHLYVANACPWAHRTTIVRAMLGLEDVVGLSVTHPVWGKTKPEKDEHCGWVFKTPGVDKDVIPLSGYSSVPVDNDCIPDTVNGAKTIRELYEMSEDVEGKYTTPLLWDKKNKCIVNNESSDIIRMFNTGFSKLHGAKEAVDIYPSHLRSQIDEINEWIYHSINNGVYKCGFARSQSAYDEAVDGLFKALDRLEKHLSENRYLVTSYDQGITEADIRLIVTLLRFDAVYVVYFKTNVRRLAEYKNIAGYTRELYQLPCIKSTTILDHIKQHYFCSHPALNTYSIIPRGPDNTIEFNLKHNRDTI